MSRSEVLSSTKIFRPWASSMSADESQSHSENTNTTPFEFANCCSAFTRVPEPHCSMDEFLKDVSKFKFTPYVDDWTANNLLPAALSSSLQANDSFVQSLSYLDSAYLNAAFPELYAASKNTKLKQRPKKFRCPHCKVSFSNNGQLKGHVRIHTGKWKKISKISIIV